MTIVAETIRGDSIEAVDVALQAFILAQTIVLTKLWSIDHSQINGQPAVTIVYDDT